LDICKPSITHTARSVPVINEEIFGSVKVKLKAFAEMEVTISMQREKAKTKYQVFTFFVLVMNTMPLS
jgi:hypothetical protein